MKNIRSLLLAIVILLSLFSALTLIVCLINLSSDSFAFNKDGFIHFVNAFGDFRNLYASTIALLSVYYWIYQMDNMEKTNERIENDLIDKKKQKTVELSRSYYTVFQPIIKKFYSKIESIDNNLLLYNNWDYQNFSSESVIHSNISWKVSFIKNKIQFQEELDSVIYELESFSANILHGEINREMMLQLIGKPFCLQVKVMYPFISIYRDQDSDKDYFSNVVELFKAWNEKV